MANPEGLKILISDVAKWNQWRADNPKIRPVLRRADLRRAKLSAADLSEADLREANLNQAEVRGASLNGANLLRAQLRGANLHKADLGNSNLAGADLHGAYLRGASLNGAKLSKANFAGADLYSVNLIGANLHKAKLARANLIRAQLDGAKLAGADLRGALLDDASITRADLRGANFTGASLERVLLIETSCDKAIFNGCRIHGLSAWNLQLAGAQQNSLVITRYYEPEITVDNLEVAQFIYLLLNNQRIRHVIDTITSKVVLILGRFTPKRKVVLEAIKDELRRRDYLPVLFDFGKPKGQTTLETINTLAGLARFVIADLTDAKSVLQELTSIVSQRPLLPIQPILVASQEEPGMLDYFRAHNSFLKTVRYREKEKLLKSLKVKVILPAEEKVKELVSSQRR
jgi:uncharacterized protein YjbI with pentapeptide repeats